MDALLGIVTVLSLGLAAAMAFIVWKLVRAERQRSDARVEALMQMASTDFVIDSPVDVAGGAETAWTQDDVPGVHSDLFAEPYRPTPWANRLAIAAGLAILLIGVGSLLKYASDTRTREAAAPTSSTASPMAPDAGGEALELLSLHHAVEGAALTITGLVQNPRGGRPLEGITATALLFGGDDALVGSGRAPLDFTRLAPGDESPFLVTVPVTAIVTRYRIGFRFSDGRVVGHVDRRSTSTPVARRE
jgi:hypothetical protein